MSVSIRLNRAVGNGHSARASVTFHPDLWHTNSTIKQCVPRRVVNIKRPSIIQSKKTAPAQMVDLIRRLDLTPTVFKEYAKRPRPNEPTKFTSRRSKRPTWVFDKLFSNARKDVQYLIITWPDVVHQDRRWWISLRHNGWNPFEILFLKAGGYVGKSYKSYVTHLAWRLNHFGIEQHERRTGETAVAHDLLVA